MGLEFKIRYHYLVVENDISRLPLLWKKKIKKAIEKKLVKSPEVFGKPLRRSLKGYRKLRVGNYRVIFRIEERSVMIFAIKHRKEVYEIVEKRI